MGEIEKEDEVKEGEWGKKGEVEIKYEKRGRRVKGSQGKVTNEKRRGGKGWEERRIFRKEGGKEGRGNRV